MIDILIGILVLIMVVAALRYIKKQKKVVQPVLAVPVAAVVVKNSATVIQKKNENYPLQETVRGFLLRGEKEKA